MNKSMWSASCARTSRRRLMGLDAFAVDGGSGHQDGASERDQLSRLAASVTVAKSNDGQITQDKAPTANQRVGGIRGRRLRCKLHIGAAASAFLFVSPALSVSQLVDETTPLVEGHTINSGSVTRQDALQTGHIYNLSFDPARYEVEQFVDGAGGQDYVVAIGQAADDVVIDDYRRNTTISHDSQEYHDALASVAGGWTTSASTDPASDPVTRSIDLGDTEITFGVDLENEDTFEGEFEGGRCLSPAVGYFVIKHGASTETKVLLYVFDAPVKLIPNADCQVELFSSPHSSTRVIAPVLVARKNQDNSISLAGRSYVSMPVVIVEPANLAITGDHKNIFVVDKAEVDAAGRQAMADFRSRQKSQPKKYHTSAELAMLIEQRLLALVKKSSVK